MAKLVNQFFKFETLEADSRKFQDLIRQVSANLKNRAVDNFIKVQSGASMNNSFYEYHREEDIPASLSRMLFSLARLRLALLGKLGWRGLIRFGQQRALLKDVLRGLLLAPFHGAKLRESTLVRMAFRSHELESAGKNKTFGRSFA
jgi:hypothetical protein